MSIVFFLIPLGLVILGVIVWAFVWAVNHGQFENLDGAAHSILYDDDEPGRGEHGTRADPAGRNDQPPDAP